MKESKRKKISLKGIIQYMLKTGRNFVGIS